MLGSMDAIADDVRAVVLVEGTSDHAALDVLAARRGFDPASLGVAIVAIGGATNIARYLALYGPSGRDLQVGGLCDEGEAPALHRRLARAGFGADLTRQQWEALGFFVCERDLEDELIRALGVDAVEHVIEGEGELASLRIMQRQPAQRGRPPAEQLRRFIGTRSGRKLRYAQALAAALEPDGIPHPLAGILDWMCARLPS
jgi:hypothetical protein